MAAVRVTVRPAAGPGPHFQAVGARDEVSRFIFELPPGNYVVGLTGERLEDRDVLVTVPEHGEVVIEPVLLHGTEAEDRTGEASLVDRRFQDFTGARAGEPGGFPADGRERALEQKRHMLDPDVVNRRFELEPVANPLPMSSFGSAESYFRIRLRAETGQFHRARVELPYDRAKLGWLDVRTLRVFEYDEKAGRMLLVPDSGSDPERTSAFAYIERPGLYGVIGLPSEGAPLEAVRLLCGLAGAEAGGDLAPLRARICDLLFCQEAPEAHGQLLPPGGWKGNACDFCQALKLAPGGLPECQIERVPGPPPGPPPAGPCQWLQAGPRNINGRIRAMATHPNNGNRVFAGAANSGVWATQDGGLSWTPLMFQEGALEIGALAVHLTNPANPAGDVTIYAGTGEPTWWPGYKGIGVLKSTASGAPGTWTPTGSIPSPGGDRFGAIVVDPTSVTANPATTVVHAGGPGGLYKSTNGGGVWNPVLIAGATKNIQGLALDPTNPAIVYAAVANEGIYRLDPGTGTWSTFNVSLATPFPQLILIVIGQSAPHKMYAKLDQAVYVYDTVTSAWHSLGSHGGTTYGYWNNVLGVDPQDSNIVFAAGFQFERTYDGGMTWQSPSVGHEDQHAVAFDPGNHLHVYVGNDGGVFAGVYASPSDVGTWSKRSDGLTISHLNSVASASIGTDLVGSGVQDNGTIRTTGGLTWDSLPIGGDGSDFIIDPANPLIVYGQLTTVGINGQPYKSTDGGNSFSPASAGLPDGNFVGKLVLDPASPPEPNRVLFVSGNDSKVYRSTNSASMWLASSPPLGGSATAIAIAPSNSAVVYAGSESGTVWRSSDNGAAVGNWKNVTVGTLPGSATLPSRQVSDIVVHPADPNTVYIGFSGFNGSQPGHVFRGSSTDGWTTWTWQDETSNLPDIPVNALEIDRTTPATLWAGTDTGVFRTTDSGMSWTSFDAGLPNVVIADLTLNAAGDLLRAAAYGYSLWEMHLGSAACPLVDVYVRDNKLDTGEATALSGVPDPTSPGSFVNWWESVDIKVDAYPYDTPPTDGVEFDRMVHDNPVRNDAGHPNPNKLYVQVHNRGPQPAHNVAVKVLYADASAALPPLPNDFWATYPNAWTAASAWFPVNAAVPFQSIPLLRPHTPAILSWDWVVPPTQAAHTCMLVVISADDDPISHSDSDPNDHLIWVVEPTDKHIALKNLVVVTGSIPPGGGGAPLGAVIELHNPTALGAYFDLGFEFGDLPVEARVSLLVPGLELKADLQASLAKGVTVRPVEGKEGWKHELVLSRQIPIDPCGGRRASALAGIRLEGGAKLPVEVVIDPGREARAGATYECSLVQGYQGAVIGGNTIEVRMEPRELTAGESGRAEEGKEGSG
jgi:hypothetical protein